MLTILAATVLQAPSAADFFPLIPGTKWTYEMTGSGSGSYTQEVGFPVDVEGKKLTPIFVKSGSKITQTTFYDCASTNVSLLGYSAKKLFDRPQPVFQIAEKGAQWTFDGPSPYEGDDAGKMSLKGQSKVVGMRDVLGEKRLCLEVKTEAKIGITDDTSTRFVQVAIYAKDVGLAEMDETVTLGKRTNRRKVKLISMEKPGA